MKEGAYRDLHRLAEKVLLQTMSDYVRLQHVKTRKKKYLSEAFQNAVDMFHDPEYRIAAFKEDDADPMTLDQFLRLAADREIVKTDKLHPYLKQESIKYWRTRDLDYMKIPSIVTVYNAPWNVEHREGTYFVDFEENRIYIDLEDPEVSIAMCNALTDILCDELGISMSGVKRKRLAEAWNATLKLNNSFK